MLQKGYLETTRLPHRLENLGNGNSQANVIEMLCYEI